MRLTEGNENIFSNEETENENIWGAFLEMGFFSVTVSPLKKRIETVLVYVHRRKEKAGSHSLRCSCVCVLCVCLDSASHNNGFCLLPNAKR